MAAPERSGAVVADTHAFIWYLEGSSRLSAAAARHLEACDETGVVHISAYTLVEVRYLVGKGALRADEEAALLAAVDSPRTDIRSVPASVEVVRHLASVPRSRLFDPADRLIVASAIELGVPLVTKDAGIASSGLLECIW